MTTYRIKRVYEAPESTDGARVLVDRMWPRGVAKADAELDQWAKTIAPSPELRRWFGHDPEKFAEFRNKYRHELAHREENREAVANLPQEDTVTLVYAAKDEEHNHAVVLRDFLSSR
ncbi:DUF488 domain-containing protein [Curtobacterium sp. S6]|uniref:DUF488 domain-containing protein n=1 Tax=Curtobacterium sp. S6 TaxID=1479623 RepID=UPI0004A9E995|nr:DUF488 family protein [Curtobacterium sp. S6]